MSDEPFTIWGTPVVADDKMTADTVRVVVGDLGASLDRLAQIASDRARESHAFEPCELDGWCAGLCHHGACLKTEVEHDA